MLSPVILAVAPNGARRTKRDHPQLPITATDMAYCAAECCEAGASLIHLHVRDDQGRHSLDPDLYRTSIAAIQRAVGDRMMVQITTEACGIYAPLQQMDVVRMVRPEAISVAIREIIPDQAAELGAANFLEFLYRERIHVQYILYSDTDVLRLQDLRKRGVIPGDSLFVLFVLGRYAPGEQSSPSDILPFLSVWPKEAGSYAICAFGAAEAACGIVSMTLDGHVRVGFENNIHLANGQIASNNAALVKQIADVAEACRRKVAKVEVTREMLRVGV